VIAGAHHVGLSVAHLDAMIAWYGEALGFAEEVRFEIPSAQISGAMLRRPDGTGLELLHHPDAVHRPPADPGSAIRAGGYGHWALSVDDVAAVHAELLRAGAREVWGPRPAPPPACGAMSYLTDPEGNLLELVEP
jgi:catechol 2,3-dioxygenase-like lactoylglutathione lyase family enzyme